MTTHLNADGKSSSVSTTTAPRTTTTTSPPNTGKDARHTHRDMRPSTNRQNLKEMIYGIKYTYTTEVVDHLVQKYGIEVELTETEKEFILKSVNEQVSNHVDALVHAEIVRNLVEYQLLDSLNID